MEKFSLSHGSGFGATLYYSETGIVLINLAPCRDREKFFLCLPSWRTDFEGSHFLLLPPPIVLLMIPSCCFVHNLIVFFFVLLSLMMVFVLLLFFMYALVRHPGDYTLVLEGASGIAQSFVQVP